MAGRTEAYLDTSALIAFLDSFDSYHPAFRRRLTEPPRLVTSALVVAEGHAFSSSGPQPHLCYSIYVPKRD
jgi:hypothetical protein